MAASTGTDRPGTGHVEAQTGSLEERKRKRCTSPNALRHMAREDICATHLPGFMSQLQIGSQETKECGVWLYIQASQTKPEQKVLEFVKYFAFQNVFNISSDSHVAVCATAAPGCNSDDFSLFLQHVSLPVRMTPSTCLIVTGCVSRECRGDGRSSTEKCKRMWSGKPKKRQNTINNRNPWMLLRHNNSHVGFTSFRSHQQTGRRLEWAEFRETVFLLCLYPACFFLFFFCFCAACKIKDNKTLQKTRIMLWKCTGCLNVPI